MSVFWWSLSPPGDTSELPMKMEGGHLHFLMVSGRGLRADKLLWAAQHLPGRGQAHEKGVKNEGGEAKPRAGPALYVQ